jgi:Ca2+-binding EF-hand superfamily protein
MAASGKLKKEQPNQGVGKKAEAALIEAGKKAEAALNARQQEISPLQGTSAASLPSQASEQHGDGESPLEPIPAILQSTKQVHVPFEDKSGPARIRIKIISAQGLRKADATGNSDPFVVCEIPGKGMICKTKVQQNTQKPVWDYDHITQYTPGHSLKFSVWDSDTLSSDLLGESELMTHRFYPYGFRGDLALKDSAKKDTQATLAVTIEAIELAEEDRAHVQDWEDDYDYDNEDWYEDGEQHEYKSYDYHEEDPEIAKYRNAFNRFDADRSGKITLAELSIAMSSLGHNETDSELRVLLNKVDKTDDGVDFMEFIILMDKLQTEEGEKPEHAKFRAMFQSFDVDNSGLISKDELKIVLQAVQKQEDMTEADINKLLNEMDTSGDGYIDFTEYLKMMEKVVSADGKRHIVAPDLTGHARAAALNHTLAPSDRKRVKAFLKRKQFPSEDVNALKNTGGAFKKKGYEYPLHTAAMENLDDMVWLLLESDADPRATNSAGETAYQAALRVENGKNTHKKVLEHLREYHDDEDPGKWVAE